MTRYLHGLAVVLDYALIALALWILLGEPRHKCCNHKEDKTVENLFETTQATGPDKSK